MATNFYPHPFDELTVELCTSARRYIRILSPQLDPEVFDNAALCDALSALARRSAKSEIRVLICDSQPMVQHGHRVLTLARRIPSLIRIQKLATHPELTGQTMVIRDMDGLIFKPGDSEHQGFYEPDSRAIVKDYVERFDEFWQRSVPDRNLRRLGL